MTLIDSFQRVATDLRVSVTDRCDFRCTYCMPAEGLNWLNRKELLTFDEITRLVKLFQSLGVTTIRLTGGEPLMRPRLHELVRALSSLDLDDLSLTTNGATLAKHAADLKAAGLKRVNVSLDSLDKHTFETMTRRARLDEVLDGIATASSAGLSPVKVNCVVIKGRNDNEIVNFARFSRETGCDVRFIEYMPLDAERTWLPGEVLSSTEIIARINDAFPLDAEADTERPARSYRFRDGSQGRIGVISSVTEPFCETCNRLRLSADGRLHTCLFATDTTDLATPMRDGADDDALGNLIRTAVGHKQSGHRIGSPLFIQPRRSMSMIGG